jgi:signal transduction histidine kinase
LLIFAVARFGIPEFVFEHIMVLLVVAAAITGGTRAAALVGAIGSFGDNVLLRAPFAPAITGMRDVLDFGLFIAVAASVGWLVNGIRAAKERAVAAAACERTTREERDRLVTTLVHDMAAPLSAIQGTVQFARKHTSLSEVDIPRLLMRLETATHRVTSLLRTLADSNALGDDSFHLDLRVVDLREVVAPIVSMFDRVSERHPVALATDGNPVVVECDPERLGRVVENLITNAIKYSPNGGSVEVSVHHDDGAGVLEVCDHGIGMPGNVRERLFERGYRSPSAEKIAPGLGLGLYIASEIVRRHGGTIGVQNPDHGGTAFVVRLPLAYRDSVDDAVLRADCQLTVDS